MVHLLDIDLMKGGCEWRMEQRFTESYVLIVATLGQGRLSIGSQHYRLRQDAVYVCPPGETFGAAAESEDGLGLFLLRYELYRIAGSNRDAVRCSGGAGFFPERGEIPVPSGARLAALCHTAYLHRQSRDSWSVSAGSLCSRNCCTLSWRTDATRPKIRIRRWSARKRTWTAITSKIFRSSSWPVWRI